MAENMKIYTGSYTDKEKPRVSEIGVLGKPKYRLHDKVRVVIDDALDNNGTDYEVIGEIVCVDPLGELFRHSEEPCYDIRMPVPIKEYYGETFKVKHIYESQILY